MWIIIHLKLLKMAPFDRSYDFPSVCHCQYRPIALYCTIFKIFDVEEYRVFEIKVGGQSPCELMHDLYIVKIFRLKRYPFALMVYGSVFIHFYTATQKSIRVRRCVTVVQGCWRSSKLVPIQSQYVTSYLSSTVKKTAWCAFVFTRYLLVTEGQTDGRTNSRHRLCLSRALACMDWERQKRQCL